MIQLLGVCYIACCKYYIQYFVNYRFLSLGTLTSLLEIGMVRSFAQGERGPSTDIAQYYLGFYVHSCQKMRYKVRYRLYFLKEFS